MTETLQKQIAFYLLYDRPDGTRGRRRVTGIISDDFPGLVVHKLYNDVDDDEGAEWRISALCGIAVVTMLKSKQQAFEIAKALAQKAKELGHSWTELAHATSTKPPRWAYQVWKAVIGNDPL